MTAAPSIVSCHWAMAKEKHGESQSHMTKSAITSLISNIFSSFQKWHVARDIAHMPMQENEVFFLMIIFNAAENSTGQMKVHDASDTQNNLFTIFLCSRPIYWINILLYN